MVDDLRIDVRFEIAALCAAMLFLFAYGDIFGFFRPGQLRDVRQERCPGSRSARVSSWQRQPT